MFVYDFIYFQVDWIHRYEVVHGYLDRLMYQDIIELIDSLTFSETAIDTLTLDLRDDITRRALKFSRQIVGKQRKKSKEDNVYVGIVFQIYCFFPYSETSG